MALRKDWSNRLIADLQRDFGLSLGAAQGLAGALAMESKGFTDWTEDAPMVPGSRGGYGMAQWTGVRRRAFEQYAKKMGLNPGSYTAQYGYLREELNGVGGHDMGAMRQLLRTTDPRTAAQITTNIFLRPGVPHMNQRMEWTDQVVSAYAPFGKVESAKYKNKNKEEAIDLAATAADAANAMAGVPLPIPRPGGTELRVMEQERENRKVISDQGLKDPPTPAPRIGAIAARTHAELNRQDRVFLPTLDPPMNAPIKSANQNKKTAREEQAAASGRVTSQVNLTDIVAPVQQQGKVKSTPSAQTKTKDKPTDEVILTELIDDGIAITQTGAPLPAGADARDRARQEAAKKGNIFDSKGGMLNSEGDLQWGGFLDENIGLEDKIKGGLIGLTNDFFGFDIRALDGTRDPNRPEGITPSEWYNQKNESAAIRARESSGRSTNQNSYWTQATGQKFGGSGSDNGLSGGPTQPSESGG